MDGQALIVRGDALHLPLPDGSVDLIVTSPPYWALRSYSAGSGEIGSEPTPQAFLEALWAATAEMVRVLKPTGSIFVDLGDVYSSTTKGSGGTGKSTLSRHTDEGRLRSQLRSQSPPHRIDPGVPAKSLMLLPERYRIGAVDRLGLIARAVIVWDKPNGLPESVQDRVRRSHEDWVHLTKGPRYYSATDEIREPQAFTGGGPSYTMRRSDMSSPDAFGHRRLPSNREHFNPLGKLPGSVWSIPSEPLTLPGYFTFQDGALLDFLGPERGGPRPRSNGHHPGLFDPDPFIEQGEDAGAWRWMRATGVTSSPWPQTDTGLQLRTAASHYAAFPSRWPEQLIKGFSPPGICVACGQGRVPVVERTPMEWRESPTIEGRTQPNGSRKPASGTMTAAATATILGYACSCTPHTDHPGSGEDNGAHGVGGNVAEGGYPGFAGRSTKRTDGGGGPHLADRPKVGPWREWHLDRWTPPPTRPAVILDPFAGTGTTPMVARALGRIGVGVDLSAPYCRAARWRVAHDGAKAISRTWIERQGSLL